MHLGQLISKASRLYPHKIGVKCMGIHLWGSLSEGEEAMFGFREDGP